MRELPPTDHQRLLSLSTCNMPLQALTELYQLLDKLNEQLGLAKNELFVANVGGRPFLLPGAAAVCLDWLG